MTVLAHRASPAEASASLASRQRWLLVLAGLFALEFALLGVQPHDRVTWALENALVVPFALLLVWRGLRRPLSRSSYVLIFAFLALHEIGSHYTYSRVPYDGWWRALTGRELGAALGWERNHFDRAVHLAFGLLLANPLREGLARVVRTRPARLTALAAAGMLALSASYELIEWIAAEVLGSDVGIAYVGAQGDVWDGQKDTGLALLGTALALGCGAALRPRAKIAAVLET